MKSVGYERSEGSDGAEPAPKSGIRNLLTIDVEDYYQVAVFSRVVGYPRWSEYENRVEKNTLRILEILNRADVKATFFVLGWIAERMPTLVREIDAQGHEVASHGYRHRSIQEQTRQEFRDDVRSAKKILEEIIKKPVYGYRAPTYSIMEKTLWALNILSEEGYRYDSSIFPIRHDRYGIPAAPRIPFVTRLCQTHPTRIEDLVSARLSSCNDYGNCRIPPDGILELPPATVRILKNNFPVAGGGYFRLLPYGFVKWGLKRINQEGNLFVFYIHPWEMDPQQPRINGVSVFTRIRHYHNLDKTEALFLRVLSDFPFTSVLSVFPQIQETS